MSEPTSASDAARGHFAPVVVIFFIVASLVPLVALWGFTVDDALISARYAANLANDHGYRLNIRGPVTDGVTPLGFAYVLSVFAKGGPLVAFAAAKIIGAVAWIFSSAVLGLAVARRVSSCRALLLVPLALIATSAPLAAWSTSGMETGLILGLGALAAALPFLGRTTFATACAGLAAALRPELLPWAAVLGTGFYLSENRPRAARFLFRIPLATGPFLLVALLRFAAFGRPAPLSAWAKAPDLRLGLMYAAACAILAGPPALVAPWAAFRLAAKERVLLLSAFCHLFAMASAGGDWMPLSRLMVPVLPSVALSALFLAERSSLWTTSIRLVAAIAGQVFVLVHIGPKAAAVGRDRFALIEQTRPVFSASSVIASLDIGWVGAASNATLVDLAGVTDPAIAALPGGHTTKQIPSNLLDNRGVDTLVLLLAPGEQAKTPWTHTRFARGVELWLATTPHMETTFIPIAETPLPHLKYLVLKRAQ